MSLTLQVRFLTLERHHHKDEPHRNDPKTMTPTPANHDEYGEDISSLTSAIGTNVGKQALFF